jgi:hypothetical protein
MSGCPSIVIFELRAPLPVVTGPACFLRAIAALALIITVVAWFAIL